MEELKKAPDILTGKDLDYLKDIFGWNYTLFKLGENTVDCVEDKEIKKLYERCNTFFYDNMNLVIDLLERNEDNE